MATSDEHLDQWKHNRRFVATIDPAYRDWQITVIFYAALHLLDAALAKLNPGLESRVAQFRDSFQRGLCRNPKSIPQPVPHFEDNAL